MKFAYADPPYLGRAEYYRAHHPDDWALPLSVHVGGPLLGKPGLTFRVGPVSIGWSRL